MDVLSDPRLAAMLAARFAEESARVEPFRRLLRHMLWADERVADALDEAVGDHDEAREIYAHVLGAEQVWLARTLGAEQGPVWPDPDPGALDDLREEIREGYASLVSALTDEELDLPIAYVNSAGDAFESTVEDILLHVFLHGAYHRGQIALLLREEGDEPVPTDYIALRRGAAAATRD